MNNVVKVDPHLLLYSAGKVEEELFECACAAAAAYPGLMVKRVDWQFAGQTTAVYLHEQV